MRTIAAPRPDARPIAQAPRYFSVGLFALRAVVGALFIGHGLQKTLGWFGGDGFAKWTASLDKMGVQPAPLWAGIEAGSELVAGALLVVGLLTPVAAAILIGDMVVATAKVHLAKGLWSQQGGFEYNLVLVAIAVALALAGPGFYSLDRRLGLLRWRIPMFVGAVAISGALSWLALIS
jgi:putative oxidoreductase